MRMFSRILAGALALLLAGAALAEGGVLALPSALRSIGEEAFAGATGFDSAVLPAHVETIAARAFADTGLTEITLPASIVEGGIAGDAFENSALEVVRAEEDTPAFRWALDAPYTLRSGNADYDYAIRDRAGTLETCKAADTAALIVPETVGGCAVTALGPGLFSGRGELGWVTVSDAVTSIAGDALSGCAPDLPIRTSAGSGAMAFAQAHDIDSQADPVCRALLVSETYPNAPYDYLLAPPNDAGSLAAALGGFADTPFEITRLIDPTAQGMLDGIADTFADAGPQDVSLFFYSGHGADDAGLEGALVGSDWKGFSWARRQTEAVYLATLVTVSQLRATLDAIPGRKIVIIDACYSGNAIVSNAASPAGLASAAPTDADARLTAEGFVASFIEGFSNALGGDSRRKKAAGANGSAYFIMTAAGPDELSFEYGSDPDASYSAFTAYLTQGCGCDSDAVPADANGNGVVTFQEAYAYAAAQLDVINARYPNPQDQQHAQVSPADCDWFGWLRQ